MNQFMKVFEKQSELLCKRKVLQVFMKSDGQL